MQWLELITVALREELELHERKGYLGFVLHRYV